MPRPKSDADAVNDYLAVKDAVDIEEVPYRAPVIAGTEVVDDEIASIVDGLLDNAVERRGKHKFYTVYDKHGTPSKVLQEQLNNRLNERTKNGSKVFFAKPPKDAPKVLETAGPDDGVVLLKVQCQECNKWIVENPEWHRPRKVTDNENLQWRKDLLLFPHMWMRHRSRIPLAFPNKERREELAQFATGTR